MSPAKGLEQAVQQQLQLLCCHADTEGVTELKAFPATGSDTGLDPKCPSPMTAKRINLHGQERWGEGVFLNPPAREAGWLQLRHSPSPALLLPGTSDTHSPPQPEQES